MSIQVAEIQEFHYPAMSIRLAKGPSGRAFHCPLPAVFFFPSINPTPESVITPT
jgi:hypothetical protein